MSTDNFIIKSPEVSVHNLERLASEVRDQYFPGAEGVPVVWGRNTGRKRRRSIRLGSYHRGTQLIRVHPLLNSPTVPVFFIQSIIYHEFLHHVLGPAHDRRFHRHERRFRFHRESKEWLAHNLPMLLGLRAKPKHVDRRRLRAKSSPQPVQLNLFGG